MALNGSGVYAPPASSWNPAVDGTVINATDWIALLADMTTALSTAVYKDGQQTVTANIPMGGFKLTGLGAGTALTDAASITQLQNHFGSYLTSVAGTNTITGTATPTPAYAVGQRFTFIPAVTNTGAATLNISSVGAGAVQYDGGALVGGELEAGLPITVLVTATTPVFEIVGIAPKASTWAPVLTFATPGDLSVVYSAQTGSFVKIGPLVSISWSIITSTFTHTTASGNCQITGVPFLSITTANFNSFGSIQWAGITKANYTSVVAQLQPNSQSLIFPASGSAQATANIATGDMPTGGNVVLSGTLTYRAVS